MKSNRQFRCSAATPAPKIKTHSALKRAKVVEFRQFNEIDRRKALSDNITRIQRQLETRNKVT